MKKFILALFTLMLAASALAACPDGMISYWTFDTSTNKFTDDYATNYITCTNCPVWSSSGKVAGALEFDGQNDRIELPL